MSSDALIRVEGLGKCYQIYDSPRDRLRQFVLPQLSRFIGGAERRYFREFWALRDVSFEVARGESVGILGRNGSGKSTLLQLITGTLTPTLGHVETSGRIAALLELGSGFNPEFTGRENVFLSLALQGFPQSQIQDRFESIAGFADIGDFIEQPVRTYSSGMYARLAFAAAIHAEPDILIVDEILAVGDAPFQQKCMKRLYRMLDDGVSVLMVSHDAYQIRSICQKALLLQTGRQIMFNRSERVMDEYIASTTEKTDVIALMPQSEVIRSQVTTVVQEAGFVVSIHDPVLISGGRRGIAELKSHDRLEIEFEYRIQGHYNDTLSFVVNLYREDGVYIFGTTTGMQGLNEFSPSLAGRVTVCFPELPLVSGKYKFRVAINDGRGMSILVEAVPVCSFSVTDDFLSVGIVDLPHTWGREIIVVDR